MALHDTSYRIEPCLLDSYPVALADVTGELLSATASLGHQLHPLTAHSLAELVRVMNCYYSNLIEGHNTRPRDIERALQNELDASGERRDLQLEARAHIRVQRVLDERHANGKLDEPAQVEFIRFIHREFYRDAPVSMLRVGTGAAAFDMRPGEFRSDPRQDIVVGRHHPPSSERVAELMAYFERRYRFAALGTTARIVAMAAAHHRLNYIHPFADGNGRVSRLMSHAMSLVAGIGAHGLWSISRGLARGLEDAGEYKRMMDLADSPRRNDLDGRGNLSQEALVEFVTWFCSVALDQVRFMSTLFDLGNLAERVDAYVHGPLGGSDAGAALAQEALRRGAFARGEASRITGLSERTAREALRHLSEAGLLASVTPKGPVSLAFTTASADVLFPRLFPAQV